jgi:hypothetical protein
MVKKILGNLFLLFYDEEIRGNLFCCNFEATPVLPDFQTKIPIWVNFGSP